MYIITQVGSLKLPKQHKILSVDIFANYLSFSRDLFIYLDIVAINGDWSTEDTLWFSERVVNHQFVSRIRDISYDPLEDNIKISVSLVDTTHPTTDIYIEKELVNDKRAVYLCL